MSVPATESVTTQGMFGTADSSSSTGKSASADKDMFLQLLVAQMRYQDPMNPTDSSQFLAQSAQFTALEKMQDVADKTAQLFQAQVSFGASGFIGKTVTWPDSDGNTQTGTVHGVTFGKDGPMLDVGATDPISIASVLSVTDGASTTAPTQTTNP
ncbi:flagellar hook capping FlgD N-terminal domain-containing protein [Nocardioides marmorisolisilvae]|uniref:Flagellar hook capping protein n=1 Tax=Nocardioides marmorisolisilvae TaxID=1542737 RepID=A0A3N0DXQ7_9ACTN|nr:flagellar hook capping FlgD N-terminal domain-containing protein [Nocardioides marmorisolisilvae]RNL80243.1 flagellar hook capping protein [Nocardioides marmorisolisilvae]